MKHIKQTLLYISLFLLTFALDRASKYYVLMYMQEPQKLTTILSCDLTFNRGISWNMFHSHDATVFYTITFIVLFITLALAMYAGYRWYHGYGILGELLIISGSMSNLVDRFLYAGVVDFIAFSCGSIKFPIFNVADVFIVLGVGIMFVMNYKEL